MSAHAGPRSAPWAVAVSVRPRPRSRSTPCSPRLPFSRRPRLPPPGGDRRLVALNGAMSRDLWGESHAVQQIRDPAQGVAGVEHPRDQIRYPSQCPPLVLGEAVRAGPCSSAWASRSRRPRSSRQTDPPGPFDLSAARPPARHRRRHTYPALVDTRGVRAISATGTSRANHSAACNRTASRVALPARTGHHHPRTSSLRHRPDLLRFAKDTPRPA